MLVQVLFQGLDKVFSVLMRAYNLQLDSTMVQGA